MLTRDFLANIDPTVKVVQFDLDAIPGNNRKEDEAGVLADAHRYDYQSHIVHFTIHTDRVTIVIIRDNKEDKK